MNWSCFEWKGGLHLRWGHAIEDHEHDHQPKYCVDHFDWELHGGEEQGEQADVAGDGERPEGAEVSAVFQGEEGEGDDDEEDGLLVDVPAEEEGGVAAKDDCREEGFPCGLEEELHEGRLCCGQLVVRLTYVGEGLTIWAASVKPKVIRGVTCGNTEKTVSPTRPRVTL